MGNAPAHDVRGRPARDALAAEADLTAQAHHAAERAQHRRLAGAIGAQEGAHAPLIEIETDPEQRLLLAVKGVEALHLEHHRRGSGPRKAPATAPARRTSARLSASHLSPQSHRATLI